MKKILSVVALMGACVMANAADYTKQVPMNQKVKEGIRDCRGGEGKNVPMITWGADAVTLMANGNSLTTQKGSVFSDAGLKVTLKREDVFSKQVAAYLKCETPWLRLTVGQLGLVSKMLNSDERTKLIPALQLSWSNGGDALVVSKGIKSAKDLKGKTVVLTADGPHIDYLASILSDAGLSLGDVTIKYTKDLTGDSDATPALAMLEGEADAVMVIIPDALALTSDGNVGTGAEGSVKGARILLSTKSASRVISDLYAVRKDYFDANKAEVQNFVHAWLKAEEKFVKSESKNKNVIKATAKYLLDAESAMADAEGLIADAETAGFVMNKRFFTDAGWPRSFSKLNKEVQSNFKKFGLVKSVTSVNHANWNYDQLQAGITTLVAETNVFSDKQYQNIVNAVSNRAATGNLDDNALFTFQINFQPNSNTISQSLFVKEFQKVIDLSAKYAGAVITIEGHADPLGYLKAKKKGQGAAILSRIRQSARNTSQSRANAVQDSIMSLAKDAGFSMDKSQFIALGHGFEQPQTGMGADGEPMPPKSKAAWLSNMRVVFKIVNVESEASEFELL